HAVEVVGSLDKGLLLLGEGWETLSELLLHGGWVISEVDWIGEPGDRELELALGGLNIAWIFWIPWVHPVTVQGDTNLSTNLILELLTVDLHSVTMGNQERVT